MDKSTACLDGLPEELLDEIITHIGFLPLPENDNPQYPSKGYFLSLSTIKSLMLVSKKFRRLAEGRLYTGYAHTLHNDPPNLRKLIRTLIKRPDLALKMRNIYLHIGRDFCRWEAGVESEGVYRKTARIPNLFCAMAQKLGIENKEAFYEQLKRGKEAAEAVLLLWLLPNLEKLAIITDFEIPCLLDWLPAKPLSGYLNSKDSAGPLPHPLLKHVDFRQHMSSSECGEFLSVLLARYLPLPSLSSICFKFELHTGVLWSGLSSNISRATVLAHDLPPQTMHIFSTAFRGLRKLYLKPTYYNRDLIPNKAAMAVIREAIFLHRESLEFLLLDLINIPDCIDKSKNNYHPAPIGDLRPLVHLKELVLHSELLTGWYSGMRLQPETMLETLPTSLEQVRFVQVCRLDLAFKSFLAYFARCGKEKLPCLRVVEVWRDYHEMMVSLSLEFAKWGVKLLEVNWGHSGVEFGDCWIGSEFRRGDVVEM